MKKELQFRIGMVLTGLSPLIQTLAFIPGQSDLISGVCAGLGLALLITSWAKKQEESWQQENAQ